MKDITVHSRLRKMRLRDWVGCGLAAMLGSTLAVGGWDAIKQGHLAATAGWLIAGVVLGALCGAFVWWQYREQRVER
jgi:hypothetical protein